jgi:putative phosphoesterase
MHVATLYELHGNLRALEAVLEKIPAEATIVVGGDVCAGGIHPSETLERLRALGERVLWLRGNADREVTPGEKGIAPAEVIGATRAALTAEQIAFLHGLPPTVQIGDILFCHATPRNDVDIFTERTPEERIEGFLAVDADIVVFGHTHTQFERTVAGKRAINSGSVGMPCEDASGATGRSTSSIATRTTMGRSPRRPDAKRRSHTSRASPSAPEHRTPDDLPFIESSRTHHRPRTCRDTLSLGRERRRRC